MANILDYLDWRGDLTLAERGFNEVDNLLMAELCFLDFSGIVPADFSAPVSLPEAMQKYDAAKPQETMGVLVPEQIPELGHKMAASRRFSDLTLCAYVSRTDEETQTQFSALTALLPDKTAYIAFRGTDDTIVGWKEDFNLAFLPVVPAQRMAAEYLAAAAAALPSHPLPRAAISRSTARCSAAKPCRTSSCACTITTAPAFARRCSACRSTGASRIRSRRSCRNRPSSECFSSMRSAMRSCAARRAVCGSTTASRGRCAGRNSSIFRISPRAASSSTRRSARSSSP